MFSTYMLHCADGSYYVGHTDDLARRLAQHQAGEGCTWTRARRPATLVWQQAFLTRIEALAAERQLKGWSRAKKQALVNGRWSQLTELARNSTMR